MIGSGAFLLPSTLAHYGSVSLVAWILSTIGAIFLALVFARVSRRLPQVGGIYVYCHHAFGDFAGFQVAYNYWVALWVGNTAIVLALVGYLGYFFPSIVHSQKLTFAVSMVVLWTFTYINARSVHQAAMIQMLATICKMIPLLAVCLVGVFCVHPHDLLPFNATHQSTASAFFASSTLTFWSFVGVESATIPADDVIAPEKNIARATIIGVSVAGLVYILGTLAVMGSMPMADLANSPAPYAEAASLMFGPWAGFVMAVAAVIATLGALNGWVLLQGQIPLAAAKHGLFPRIFQKTNRNHSPVWGLVLGSCFASILLWVSMTDTLVHQFTLIILVATFATLIAYFYTSLSEVMLQVKSGLPLSRMGYFRLIFIASIAFLFSVWAILGSGIVIMGDWMVLFLSSLPLYIWVKAQHR